MSAADVLKVKHTRPDLQLAAGDYLVVGSDGVPICVFRKLEPETAARYVEAFGLPVSTTLPAHDDAC